MNRGRNICKIFSTRWLAPDANSHIVEKVGKAISVGNITGKKTDQEIAFVNEPSKILVTNAPPLTEPLKGLPEIEYTKSNIDDNEVKVTCLSNGLQVASKCRLGHYCTVGVIIHSGPRYETLNINGVSQFLEKMAFSGTKHFPTKNAILTELELNGSIADCQSCRDSYILSAHMNSKALKPIVRVLGDIILRPALLPKEIMAAGKTIAFEWEAMYLKPEQEPIIMDMVHTAAYGDTTLGLPKICPVKNIHLINKTALIDYMSKTYRPDKMIIVGVGVNHEELVDYANEYFVQEKPLWIPYEKSSSPFSIDEIKSVFIGGSMVEDCEIPYYVDSGLPQLVHVVFGLESSSHYDHDFIPILVLNVMMGGGGSFSTGGPGKGIHSRLYTILSQYHWLYNATAYNHAYNDSGLFCIHASCTPKYTPQMVEAIVLELIKMADEPSEVELKRSKIQLQTMLLMNFELRSVEFEDIGRQILSTGLRKFPQAYIQEIEDVTSEDIKRVARRLLSSPLALAARGNIAYLPEFREVQAALIVNAQQDIKNKTPN